MTDTSSNVSALHDQRDWLLVTLSCIGDAVITTDGEGRVTFLNPVAESLTGWTQEAVGQSLDSIFRIINEESRQPVEIPTLQALREGRTAKLASHSLLIAKDGTERPISDGAAPITNDKGEVAGVVLVFRDISERRHTERALEKTLAYADDIIATLREPFLVLDIDLRVKTANRSFYESFHVSKEETEKRLVYDLGNGQWNIPGLRTLLDQVLSRNQSVHDYEVEHSFPILGRKTMLLNARPFPPDSEHPELILLAVEDVSAVRERADELAEANRNKDEFLATLAHELRNPLAPIRSAVRLLRLKGSEEPEFQPSREVEVIDRQVDHLTRLIDDLLDVSRISRGKIELRKRRVELAEIIQGAIESSRPLIDQHGHELSVTLPTQLVHLEADMVRLVQVFMNLLNNAAKYTEQGGHLCLIAEQEGGEVVVKVTDTGIGIPSNKLPHLFEMFFQVDHSLERSGGGLGIGLTLVRRLVEMHGGTVEARSEGPGKGSQFLVHLPVVVVEEPTLPPLESGTDPPKPRIPRRILVVDDECDSAELLAKLLRLDGHEVHTAHDGVQAVEAAERLRPEVVILDIGMPRMNGCDACRRIREQPWGSNLTLIALTGWEQEKDRRRTKEAGFDHHLVKPVDPIALDRLLAGIQSTIA